MFNYSKYMQLNIIAKDLHMGSNFKFNGRNSQIEIDIYRLTLRLEPGQQWQGAAESASVERRESGDWNWAKADLATCRVAGPRSRARGDLEKKAGEELKAVGKAASNRRRSGAGE